MGRFLSAVVLAAMLPLAACTTTQQGALIGGGVGAASGAIVGGGAFGEPGIGALVGAGAGALAGALVGDALEQTERQAYYEGQAAGAPPSRTYGAASASGGPLYATRPDPTRGEIINATPWEVEVSVDDDQAVSGSPLRLAPRESRPMSLDVGPHRIAARAYVETQFGPRLVGVYDHTVHVDPKASGWSLKLQEQHF